LQTIREREGISPSFLSRLLKSRAISKLKGKSMAISMHTIVEISNLRSKTFRGQNPEELDQALNQWLQSHSGSIIVSMESHSTDYYCWVVILYRDKSAGVI